jgi:hypothetical protein
MDRLQPTIEAVKKHHTIQRYTMQHNTTQHSLSYLPTFQAPLLPHTNRNEITPILQTLRALGIKALILPFQDTQPNQTLYTSHHTVTTGTTLHTTKHTTQHNTQGTASIATPSPLWQTFLLETLATGILLVLLTHDEHALRKTLQDTLGAAFMKQIHISADHSGSPLTILRQYQRETYLKPHQLLYLTQQPTYITELRTHGFHARLLPTTLQELLP